MKCIRRVAVVLAAAAVSAAATAQQTQPAATRVIDARCDEALRKMCDHLQSLKSFSFEAEILFDEVDAGQKITLAKTLRCDVQRPNRARGHAVGDDGERKYWYDGKQVSILDATSNVYCTTEVPDTLDATLDMMATKYGLAIPTSDLLYSDAYATLMEGVERARFVGKHRVSGHECLHLAFSQESLDWQLWIEAGEHPFPRRMVVSYKGLPGSPQFVATFTKWDASAKFDEKHFQFQPSPGMDRIDLVPVDAEAAAPPTAETKSP